MYRNVGARGEATYTALTLRSACSPSSPKPAMCGVKGQDPLPFSGGSKGGILFGKRIPLFLAAAQSAALTHAAQRAATPPPPLQGGNKKGPSLAREKVPFISSLSKPYRYFCIPSVARAGSPETEMVNFTPEALLKRSSSLRKLSASWLHSPPVILNRLSMKMWEIS